MEMKVVESKSFYLLVDASVPEISNPFRSLKHYFPKMVRPCRKMPFWSTEKRPI